ncbi:hypothetical protein J437_LFUL011615 [Ladona fulva]|uniref:Uncharacterized protein n=1 Tax=Ladona fulva TaxID=123851 RepID=A0A8K0P5X7_LADFU|nr:hypothetical protein J437_LFUL011615 [Ladona fulva]
MPVGIFFEQALEVKNLLRQRSGNCHPEAPNLKTSNFFYSSFSIIWIQLKSSEKKTSMCQRVSRFVKKSLDRITSKARTLTA